MKKYQLIGRRRLFTFKKPTTITYPLIHICSFPLEILLQIFQQIDNKSLLNLSLVCKRFHHIINKYFLYYNINFKSPSTFYKFSIVHLLNDINSNINYLTSVQLTNPQIQDSSKYKIKIAGSFNIESESRTVDQLNYNEFINSIKCLFANAFGLKCLIISEISREFTFPESQVTSGLRFKRKVVQSKRTLEKLVLKTQSGWSIPFKQGHISLIVEYFNIIEEFNLVNFIIDDTKPINIEVYVNKFVVDGCIYTNSFKKSRKPQPSTIFNHINTLELKNILNDSGLSLIDLIKLNNLKLSHLIIDISSNMFYIGSEFNFTRFNPFFNLFCSGYGNFTHLTLYNFALFEYFKHDVIHDSDSWIEPPLNNFETFMKYISQIKYLVIILRENSNSHFKTCIKCGFTEQLQDRKLTSLTLKEWEIFLTPLQLSNNSLKIYYKNKLIYTN